MIKELSPAAAAQIRTACQHGGMDLPVSVHAIGYVRTPYADREATPIQAGLNRAEEATIEIDAAYAEGLDGLAGFDYAWLLTWLHQFRDAPGSPPPLRQVPFLLRSRQTLVGMFATRTPRRVNPIGLSLIRLLSVDGLVITFAGVDLVDGTPVVDIKPYVTRFDQPAGPPRCGWFDTVAMREGSTPGALGPPSPLGEPGP